MITDPFLSLKEALVLLITQSLKFYTFFRSIKSYLFKTELKMKFSVLSDTVERSGKVPFSHPIPTFVAQPTITRERRAFFKVEQWSVTDLISAAAAAAAAVAAAAAPLTL